MKKRFFFHYCILSILLFLTIYQGYTQDTDLEKAKTYEQEKNIDDALTLYKAWLINHPGDDDFINNLKHVIQLEDNSKELVTFLNLIDTICQKRNEKLLIAQSLAHFEELFGNLTKARKYYLYLFNNSSGEHRFLSLLSAAQIFFQQGMFEKSREALNIINKYSKNEEIIAKAGILLSSLYLVSEEWEKAEKNYLLLIKKYKSTKIYPVILLSYLEFLNFSGKEEEIKKIINIFDEYFPFSPEYFLALEITHLSEIDRISYYPNPSFFISYTGKDNYPDNDEKTKEQNKPDTVYIQTGSFIVRENAEDMIVELLKNKFKGIIVEKEINKKIYFRVLVKIDSPEPDIINNYILQLKEAGFEGFLVIE